MKDELPTLTPERQAQITRLHEECARILDYYVSGFEIDMNRWAVKNGPMDPDRAHFDMTLKLAQDVPHNMMAGLVAEAICRGIAKKKAGKG